PFKPVIMHMDFLRVSANEKLHMSVPLHFINEEQAEGVLAGGVISHSMHHLDITCLPADLPESIEVDLAKLAMNAVMHLSDIKLPKGVEIAAKLHDENPALASIHPQRVVAEDIEPEEAPAAEESATEEESASTETPSQAE
ncbi:MAG: 50S ribosomal protein L25/general stress protein Ctc, partial [Gammaproteobacteria bacterium]|nr:50S ribosomal protein L25/general stress protein Ctc [Gammaproteobacteria bacterium]